MAYDGVVDALEPPPIVSADRDSRGFLSSVGGGGSVVLCGHELVMIEAEEGGEWRCEMTATIKVMIAVVAMVVCKGAEHSKLLFHNFLDLANSGFDRHMQHHTWETPCRVSQLIIKATK